MSATGGNGAATVSWTAPSNDGGSAITGYTVTPYRAARPRRPRSTVGASATSATVSGLTNGTAYTFTVSATNAIGTGPASTPSNSVTPSAPTVPGAPTAVTAAGGNTAAVVSWTAPSNGGSAITSYTITPYIGTTAQATTTVTGSPPATQGLVSGLTNGTAYTFTVTATNAVGTGSASSSSNSVTPNAPPAVTSVTPSSGATSVPTSVTPAATFSQAVVPSTVSFTVQDSSGNQVGGTVGFSSGNTVATFTPTNPLVASTTYTATVSGAQNSNGTPMSSPFSWSFTVAVPQCPCSVWGNATPVGAVDASDTNSVNLGVQFKAASSGTITGVRFYKESDNTGTHVGSLWSSTGSLLASGTFSNETASGWQELDFSTPVAVTAGTTYVASYFTTSGHYAATANGLASAVTNGPLTALASGGVYTYNSANAFPSSTYQASNYWVDVVYSLSATTLPGAPTGVSASPGNASATVSWTAPSSNGGSPITSYIVTPYIGSTAQATTTVSASATSATVSGLTNGTAYTFTVSATNANGTGPASSPSNSVTPNTAATIPGAPTGVSAIAGNASATVSWTAPSNGGSVITSYTVTPYIGATAQTTKTVTGSPPATSTTVTGLTNGTTYTFTVSATNAIGPGPASAQSNSVTPNTPPTVSSVTPAAGATGVSVSVAPTATFSQAVVPSTASFTVQDSSGNQVGGTVAFSSGNTVATFTPTNPLAASSTYTATVSGAQNTSGVPMSSPFVWNFTTAGPQCPCSVWGNAAPTGAVDASDTSPVNVGIRVQAASSGFISGVRFYKESDNTGTHTGSLWSSTGTLLASGTFSNETASGWQELDFSTPVAVTAGTTYVASYFTTTGHYAATANGLASAVTNGPLTALAGGGVYVYGSASAFPSSSYQASNYWVDVVYSPTSGTAPPTVTTVSPSAGSTGNPASVAPTATFNQPVTPSTVSFTVKDSTGNAVGGAVSFNAANTVATFTPTSALAAGATYTATVSGAQNTSGTPMSSPFSWSFTISTGNGCPCSVWQNAAPSGAGDANDTSAVNLGIRFQASSSGKIIGVRFYKEVDNTGSHVGSLWSSTGTLLATGTFSNETASGWQELDFTSPVTITAGTTYVASYFTSTGHYAFTSGGLSSAVTNGPLTALASGGVYAYGSSNAFPSSSYNATNYWVDVVYSP